MSEALSSSLYGISFFLSLVFVGLIWWTVAKFPKTPRFWVFLAIGWSMNLIADLSWGVLYISGTEIWLDWIDYFYIGRYLVIFLAFLLFPKIWGWQQWVGTLASMLLGSLLIWLLITRPVVNPDPDYALGGLIFPIMDLGLIYASWYRWRTATTPPDQKVMIWIFLGMLAYGTANIFNYSVRVVRQYIVSGKSTLTTL
jgi:hypothetical protein